MRTGQSTSSNIDINGENAFSFGCLFLCLVVCVPFLLLSTYSSHQEPIVSIINADVNQGITLQEKTINVINGQVSREDMQASEKLGIKLPILRVGVLSNGITELFWGTNLDPASCTTLY